MKKYQLYPSVVNFETLININKLLKVNVIVYDKESRSVYGYCQDNTDYNVLKVFSPKLQYDFNAKYLDQMQVMFPNFAALSKDVSFIYKTANINSANIGLDYLDYRGEGKEFAFRFGVKAFRTTIIEEERLCYDYLPFKQKMEAIITEMSLLPNSNAYTDIMTINEFKEAIEAPAFRGIIPVRYDNSVYFIVSNMINAKKGEKIDLIVKTNNSNGTRLLNYKIHKKDGILNVIYRQFIL